MQPAVVTLRPDNFLTVGLVVLIAYTLAVLAYQLAMRGGLVKSSQAAAS
jgi:hypothetical protein